MLGGWQDQGEQRGIGKKEAISGPAVTPCRAVGHPEART